MRKRLMEKTSNPKPKSKRLWLIPIIAITPIVILFVWIPKFLSIPLYGIVPVTMALSIFSPLVSIAAAIVPLVGFLLIFLIVLCWAIVWMITLVPPLFVLWFSEDFINIFGVKGTMLSTVDKLANWFQPTSPLAVTCYVIVGVSLAVAVISYFATWIFLIIGRFINKLSPFFNISIIAYILYTLAVILLFIIIALIAGIITLVIVFSK